MTERVLCLAKDGHDFVFRYRSGGEEEIIDELMRLADDAETKIDWIDAATLSFRVAEDSAGACRKTVMCAPGVKRGQGMRIDRTDMPPGGPDDAKDGPCESSNCP